MVFETLTQSQSCIFNTFFWNQWSFHLSQTALDPAVLLCIPYEWSYALSNLVLGTAFHNKSQSYKPYISSKNFHFLYCSNTSIKSSIFGQSSGFPHHTFLWCISSCESRKCGCLHVANQMEPPVFLAPLRRPRIVPPSHPRRKAVFDFRGQFKIY